MAPKRVWWVLALTTAVAQLFVFSVEAQVTGANTATPVGADDIGILSGPDDNSATPGILGNSSGMSSGTGVDDPTNATMGTVDSSVTAGSASSASPSATGDDSPASPSGVFNGRSPRQDITIPILVTQSGRCMISL